MCMIVGDPVKHSLSPIMHNSAYKELGIDDEFVFTAANVKSENIEDVIRAVRVMNIRGLTCTIPHKMEVMKYIDEIDPVAMKIGAVNTVVNDDGVLKGYNTDWLGTVIPLAMALDNDPATKFLEGKKVALIGAGGAARAMAFGVIEKGANLTIYNRTVQKAEKLAGELDRDAQVRSLDSISEVSDADIIINSTSIGMEGNEDSTPCDEKFFNEDQIVFDAVYIPYETRFLREARYSGAHIIHGIEMLLFQGIAQFEYYTGHKAPTDNMKASLFKHFNLPGK